MCKKYEDLNEIEKLEVISALQQYLDDINYRKIRETSKALEDELNYVDKDIKRISEKVNYFNEKLNSCYVDDCLFYGLIATSGIVVAQAFTSEKINGMALVLEYILGAGISGLISHLKNRQIKKGFQESNNELNDLIELKEDIQKRLCISDEVAKVYRFTHGIK